MATAAATPAPASTDSATAEKVIPSFNAEVERSTARRTAELAPEPAAAVSTDPPDFAAQYEKLPEDLRSWVWEAQLGAVSKALTDKYGDLSDVVPLLEEFKADPELRATLAQAAKSPEFRKALADPRTRKLIGELDNDDLIDFVSGHAVEAYRKVNPSAPAPDKSVTDAVAEVERKFQERDDRSATDSWLASQRSQVQALASEFPDLNRAESAGLVNHIVTVAEGAFERAAQQRGVRVYDEKGAVRPTWPAEALRAGLSPASYRENYLAYQKTVGKAPPAAPGTTAAEPPKQPQAPRTRAEAVAAGREMLAKNGGFNALAARRGRRQ